MPRRSPRSFGPTRCRKGPMAGSCPCCPGFRTWNEEGPPKGTISHYPNKGDQVPIIAGAPAPPLIAAQIYTQALMPKMILKQAQGEGMEKTLAWAMSELEG